MPDPLSIAASSFAVVGVADFVLRASIECCRFLSEIKDAPDEISRLQISIKENKQLVNALKTHLNDLRDPASLISFSAVELNQAFDGFNTSVRALKRELNNLLGLEKRHNGVDKTWGRVKWLLDERKVRKSLEKLEWSKSTLSVSLSLVEGFVDSLTIHLLAPLKVLENVVQQNFQRITSTMSMQLQELSVVRDGEEKMLGEQENIRLQSTQQLKKIGLIRKDQLKASRIDQMEHAKTRGIITEGHRKVMNAISKLQDSRTTLSKAPIIARKTNREIYFIGERRESILTPLLLMKDHVRWAVLHVASCHAERISPKHLFWLRSEFDSLISSATQEAAAICPGSTAMPFDQWNYSTGSTPFSDTGVPLGAPISRDDFEDEGHSRATIIGHHGTAHRRRFRFDHQVFSSSSPAGQLHMTVPLISNVPNVTYNMDEARLSFIPSIGICSTSIDARFVKSMNYGPEPRLYVQLNAFRLVEDLGLHRTLFCNGTLEEIDAAFRSGIYAARYIRPEVLQYLDNQGVGPVALNGELDALDGLWDGIQGLCSEMSSIELFYQTLSYFDEKTTTFNSSHSESLLHAVCWHPELSFPEKTPLLDHVMGIGGRSLATVRLLLEFGVNLDAADLDGRNAIHAAMYSNIRLGERMLPEVLEEMLSLLIEAGVDLHHRDKWGDTPSYSARYDHKCWAAWCRALERNGRKIDEVVQEDEELWLLEESSEEE
ncbi:uncharacterized protein BDR25DRAFT_255524, partial [Lindgomyces ingoldianus]